MIARLRRWWHRRKTPINVIYPYEAFLMLNNMDYTERRRHGL